MLVQMDLADKGDVEVDPLTINQLSLVFLNMRNPDRCSHCNGRGWCLRTKYIMSRCHMCDGKGVVSRQPVESGFDPIALGC